MPINKINNKEINPQVINPDVVSDLTNEIIEKTTEQASEVKLETGSLDREGKKGNETGVSINTTPAIVANPAPVEVKSELRQAVERVMEADLRDLYLAMTPAERQIFKKKGEETAREITSLIEKTKINLNKIIKLLFGWLRLLPGVNNYFVEQEAKLKADQLLKLPK